MRRVMFRGVGAAFFTALVVSGANAFQAEGASSVFAYVNESAGRSLTGRRTPARPGVCSAGCKQQRSIAPVRRAKDLTGAARRLHDSATKLFDAGKFSEAAAGFAQSARLKPSYDAYVGLGGSYYRLKRPDDALKAYAQAIKLNPKLDEAYFNIGVIRFEQKAYTDALEALKTAVSIPPADADEHYYYGLTLNELKRRDEAITAFRESIQIDPPYYDAYTQLAALNDRPGQRKEAVELLTKATKMRPDKGEAFLSLGDVLYNDAQFDQSLAAYLDAVRLMPGNAAAHAALGDVQYKLVRSAEAIGSYEKALRLKPELRNDWGVAVRYGNSLRLLGKTMEGIQWLNTALQIDPKEDTPLYLIGMAYMDAPQPDLTAAINALTRAAEIDPSRKETFLLLTNAYISSAPRMPAEALKAARRAEQLAPNDAEVLFYVGSALATGQMFEPAADIFRKVVSLKPDFAIAQTQLCSLMFVLQNYKEGMPVCRRSVALSNSQTRSLARAVLANMYSLSKDYDRAIAELQAVIKDDPKFVYAHQALGVTYMLMKKWDKSIAAFKEAIRIEPENAESHLQLGAVYWEAGKSSEANQEYAILLNLNPKYAEQLKSVFTEESSKKPKNKR